MKVTTVTGPIGREELGVVTSHEHVLLDLTAFYQALPVDGVDDPATQKVEMWNLGILSRDCYALKDNLLLDSEALAVKELGYFKKAGGNTVVELHMADGKTVSVQAFMSGAYPFLDQAFASWCTQTGTAPESCEFHDPSQSCWFPPAGKD